jgi:predicted nucleic acid-binding protein
LSDWRRRFSDRIFGLTEEAAMAYGEIMGSASRQGFGMSAPDGMIAAIARVNGGSLAMRNLSDFRATGSHWFPHGNSDADRRSVAQPALFAG